MKNTLFVLVALAVVNLTFSAILMYPKVEGKPGDCWANITGSMVAGEQKNVEGQCSQANCMSNGIIQVFTCGVLSGPNGATETDYSKPYPDCCPQPL